MNRKQRISLLSLAILACAMQGLAFGQSSEDAFMPLCVGDVSSWIRIRMQTQTQRYWPPTLFSSSIERDTTISGEQYAYVSFPPEAEIPEGWMRSDSAGLYLRRGEGDSLIVPASADIEERVSGGKVIDTFTVSTQYGTLPAYRVVRASFPSRRLYWTWVRGLGLWEITVSQGSEVTHFHFLSGMRCGKGSENLPVVFDVPLRLGDIVVHKLSDVSGAELGYRVQSAVDALFGPRWIISNPPDGGGHALRNFVVTVDTDGQVRYQANDMLGTGQAFVSYPAYSPALDTVVMDGLPYFVTARFDTTIFSDTVRAFALRSTDQLAPRTVIIADRFGMVYEKAGGVVASLHSAVVNGRKYNRNTVRRRFLPLCDSSVFEYKMIGPFSHGFGRMKIRDSTFLGVTSLFYGPPGMAVLGGSSMRYPMRGLFTEQADGVYDSKRKLVFPFEANLGDTMRTGVVIGLEQREVLGGLRWTMHTAEIWDDILRRDVYVEDAGLYSSDIEEAGTGRFTWTLTGAIVCGEAFGEVLAMDEAYPRSIASNVTAYPNPAPAGSGRIFINVQAASQGIASLTVVDLLGRVRMASETFVRDGSHAIPVSISSLEPGMYMLVVITGQHRTWTRLMIR